MAATTILNAYDLSGGATESSVVQSPDNVNIGWKLSSFAGTGIVVLTWKVQVGSEDYHTLKDINRRDIVVKLKANESNNLPVTGNNGTN